MPYRTGPRSRRFRFALGNCAGRGLAEAAGAAARMGRRSLAVAAALLAWAVPAEIEPETVGNAMLPELRGDAWVWLHDYGGGGRSLLVDAASGEWIGSLGRSILSADLLMPRQGDHFYTVDTYFARGQRGERTDTLNYIDWRSLLVTGEVVIPPKKMVSIPPHGMSALTGDERFAAVQNFTPNQSVTVIDLASRAVVAETATPGCHGLYPSGVRQLNVICGDGAFLQIVLDETGAVASMARSAEWFDAEEDAVEMRAARIGETWYFGTLNGEIVPVSFAADGSLAPGERFRYATEAEALEGWTMAGGVPMDAAGGRLYVLTQSAGYDEHEGTGSEVWVFDPTSGERVSRIELVNDASGLVVTGGASPLLVTSAYHVPLPGWALTLLGWFGDDEVLSDLYRPVLDVYDAGGEHQRGIEKLVGPVHMHAVRPGD